MDAVPPATVPAAHLTTVQPLFDGTYLLDGTLGAVGVEVPIGR